MHPTNLLFLCSDQHARDALGCYGHPLVRTPHLDALAAAGTRFTASYSSSPICVPARAAIATGRHVHQCRAWSSAEPYDGSIPGWGHRLIEAGHRVLSIGKLHYRRREDPNGFDTEILPMHVHEGVGWTTALLRDTQPMPSTADFARDIGWGESEYTRYDRAIGDAACRWLREEAPADPARPWVLFVSFVSPHNPMIAPPEHESWYPPARIEMPRAYRREERHRHPVPAGVERCMDHDAFVEDDDHVRAIRASYYGLCSFLDAQVGRVLEALNATGQRERTRILYTSDHGEMLGHLGYWAKSLMYEASVGIPMILSGPGIPEGKAIDTPVSHVDCHPTILRSVGLPRCASERDLPGESLAAIAHGEGRERTVLSEYHDGGAVTGMFMIRHERFKYVHYPGFAPELFDLAADPDEVRNLGEVAEAAPIRRACEARLRALLDPDAVNAQAFADQRRRLEALGGARARGFRPRNGLYPRARALTRIGQTRMFIGAEHSAGMQDCVHASERRFLTGSIAGRPTCQASLLVARGTASGPRFAVRHSRSPGASSDLRRKVLPPITRLAAGAFTPLGGDASMMVPPSPPPAAGRQSMGFATKRTP